MTTVAIIPARYESTRFPGKPLANKTGKFLIQHVYENIRPCDIIDQVIVATDDGRIVEAVKSFGGRAQMTRPDHPSGTDRIAEVVRRLNLADSDLVLNVQGDEPEISPDVLRELVTAMNDKVHPCTIGTLATPFATEGPKTGHGSPLDPNCVKVVVDKSGRALYFSRGLIPYPQQTSGAVDNPSRWLLHLGVYAFRAETLRAITDPDHKHPSPLAQAESLEQLRWLERGFNIKTVIVKHRFVGIDTPADYEAFVQRIKNQTRAVAQPRRAD